MEAAARDTELELSVQLAHAAALLGRRNACKHALKRAATIQEQVSGVSYHQGARGGELALLGGRGVARRARRGSTRRAGRGRGRFYIFNRSSLLPTPGDTSALGTSSRCSRAQLHVAVCTPYATIAHWLPPLLRQAKY